MAYLRKDDIVIIKQTDSDALQALVVDVRFRRFRKSWKDKACLLYTSDAADDS